MIRLLALIMVACICGCEDMPGSNSNETNYTLADGACVIIVDGEGTTIDEACSDDNSTVAAEKQVYVLLDEEVVILDERGTVLKTVKKPQVKPAE